MYSGITRGLFEVIDLDIQPGLSIYTVRLNALLVRNLTIGASVAIDGVCQTVVAVVDHDVTFNAIQDTLDRTTLNELYLGRKVSVERSLCYGDEIGGHEVSGHVNGTATIVELVCTENNLHLVVKCPPEWMKFIFMKGFIAVNGSSLTVGEVDAAGKFTLNLIPATLQLTNFANLHVGDLVNIELDYKTQVIVYTVEKVLNNCHSPRHVWTPPWLSRIVLTFKQNKG